MNRIELTQGCLNSQLTVVILSIGVLSLLLFFLSFVPFFLAFSYAFLILFVFLPLFLFLFLPLSLSLACLQKKSGKEKEEKGNRKKGKRKWVKRNASSLIFFSPPHQPIRTLRFSNQKEDSENHWMKKIDQKIIGKWFDWNARESWKSERERERGGFRSFNSKPPKMGHCVCVCVCMCMCMCVSFFGLEVTLYRLVPPREVGMNFLFS